MDLTTDPSNVSTFPNVYEYETLSMPSGLLHQINVTTPYPEQNPTALLTTPLLSGLMSTELQELLNFIDFIVLQAVILFPGIFANAVNIAVFLKLGLADPVTISFFALSVTDMVCLLIAAYNWLCYTLYRVPAGGWPVDMFSLMYLGVWYFQMVYDVSMLITTYTAVQKCCCIALPLHFKSVFTKTRTCIVIAAFIVICMTSYVPLLATQGLQRKTNPATNASTYTIWYASDREEIISANDIIVRIILQNACEIIVVSCLIILTTSLRRHSKFRHSVSIHSLSECSSEGSLPSLGSQETPIGAKTSRISAKELQVIKSVTLVSAIFVTCNFPRVVLSIARTIVPEMDTFRRYHNIHLTSQMIRRVIEVSGASGNFIIYYKFNRRFREIVNRIFKCSD